jgi:hypothetical protein
VKTDDAAQGALQVQALTFDEAMKLAPEEVEERLAILKEMDEAAYAAAGILASMADLFKDKLPQKVTDAVARLRAAFAAYEAVNVVTKMKRGLQ